MVKKINLNFREDNFSNFLQKINILAKISDTIKIKIDGDSLLMYSSLGNESVTLIFKSFVLKTDDYLNISDEKIDIIIPYAKKFSKNLEFINNGTPIKFDLNYRENDQGVYMGRSFTIKSGKLKLTVQCGEDTEIKDITKGILERNLSNDNRLWDFTVSLEDFKTIKKLSQINSSPEEIRKLIEISTDSGDVKISEVPIWELVVSNSNVDSGKSLLFNKAYLNFIPEMENIEFSIFRNFILIKEDISYTMISFETDFDY